MQALGKGTYGEVVSAKHRETGQIRAVKTIPRSKIKNWERFQTEVKILQQLVSAKTGCPLSNNHSPYARRITQT